MKTPIVADATAEMVALMTDRMHALEMRSDERDKDVVGLMEAFVQLGKLTKRTMEEARDTRDAYVAQLTRMDAQDARMDAQDASVESLRTFAHYRVAELDDDAKTLKMKVRNLKITGELEWGLLSDRIRCLERKAGSASRLRRPQRQPSVREFFKPV